MQRSSVIDGAGCLCNFSWVHNFENLTPKFFPSSAVFLPLISTMGPTVMMKKRLQEAESSQSTQQEVKRQKVDVTGDASKTKVGATELASAFALASLATFSPKSTRVDQSPETRDEVVSNLSWEERSPKNEPVPISPETRSPSRQAKRVHFAPGIKEVTRKAERYGAFPTRNLPMQASKMPPGFSRGAYQPRQLPPPWMRPQRMMVHQHQPQQQHHHHAGFMPPPMMPMMPPTPPMMPPTTSSWICDFCNVAAFATYQEACVHEEACRIRCSMPPRRSPMWQPVSPNSAPSFPPPRFAMPEREEVVHALQRMPSSTDRVWFQGSASLSIPDSDSEWLSEQNCFVRATCLETFSATEDDISRTSKRGRIALHQVGIRCRFCCHRPLNERAVAAVSYPTSVAGIYESVKRWQRVHLETCQDTPQDVKAKLAYLASTNVWIPTTRQYWADSARALGMVDTKDGIRFGSDPNGQPDKSKIATSQTLETSAGQVYNEDGGEEYTEGTTLSDGDGIVYSGDTSMVPPYVHFLMRQTETCHFTEADRFVARSKGPVGYPGFQCRHCAGHAGLGKYFPVSAKSLSTNSTSQNIHAHLLKCRKCPVYVKEQLVNLKEEKGRTPRLEPGWRKIFFDKVWIRLHGETEIQQV